MPNFISEDQIEKATLQLLKEKLGYNLLNAYTADPEAPGDGTARNSKKEVVLPQVLERCVRSLKPQIPAEVVVGALQKLQASRRSMSPVQANYAVYSMIKNGIAVEYEDEGGEKQHETLRLIDFNRFEANTFTAVSQLWIKGERYYRRPDILIYINGIPLVFIELKDSNVKVKQAYDDNLTNYRRDIPQLFDYNGFCILSNAVETKIGAAHAGWDFYFNWLRVDDEREIIDRREIERRATSLERVVYGLLEKRRLLDYLENFILYYKETNKIIAQNHQFLGVNKAIDSFRLRKEKQGKLGVFWHTQGSGKSFSMIFLSRKIFRKYPGNYTFVIITDREDLDGQIYRNFLNTDTVKKNEAARPKNSREMRDFLGRNLRYVFTLIQKFRYDKGQQYPLLSDRNDIIVIVDEAHRTQYKSLAENMRAGLPNAQYYAFTGTPLLASRIDRDGKTRKWFGEYVSEYNFAQSIEDGATVPLYYEKRVPEVLIQNENLSDEFYEILEDENLDEAQQEKLEKEFSKEIEVIKRDDRLETIARDIVTHFPRRGYLGKGMVISVDKFTSVKMLEKVQRLWKQSIKELVGQITHTADEIKKSKLQQQLDYMRRVEMTVVISEEAGEAEKFMQLGLEIAPHREKLNSVDKNGHDIEYRFKDPEDPLQLVFVCAMWLTGFDAPTVSTLYLDKPMKDHTLMQAIARANRVTSYEIRGVRKTNGEIVDYYNVFRNMKKALKDYALGSEDGQRDPVQEKAELFVLLDNAIAEGQRFCESLGIDVTKVLEQGRQVFKNIQLFNEFADILLSRDEYRKEFYVYENTITSLYEACKPEILGKEFRPLVPVFQYLRGVLDSIVGDADIEQVQRRVAELLDQSVISDKRGFEAADAKPAYQIMHKSRVWDLGKIDYEKLRKEFKQTSYKNIEIADMRAFIEQKLEQMLRDNATRTDFAQRFQAIIDEYNSGGASTENYFEELLKFTQAMREEDERHAREGLTKAELELFDIIKKDALTQDEKKRVKLAAKDLLKRLLQTSPKVLVQDWYKDSQSKLKVRKAIEEVLDEDLPASYDRREFKATCDRTFELIYEYASKGSKWSA